MVGIVVVEQVGGWKTKEFCFEYWIAVANIKEKQILKPHLFMTVFEPYKGLWYLHLEWHWMRLTWCEHVVWYIQYCGVRPND